jgi:hypothetical protein
MMTAMMLASVLTGIASSQAASADPVCTYGYSKGSTWTDASIASGCGRKMQARISRYFGGIHNYDGPQSAHSHVSNSTGTLAGNYWRGQVLSSATAWSNWASIP